MSSFSTGSSGGLSTAPSASPQELGKTIRAVKNGELDRSDGTRDIFMLDKLRAATPNMDAAGGAYTCVVNIQPIACGTYFTKEACEHLARTGQLPPDATITLIEEPAPESVPALERLEAEVVSLHRSDRNIEHLIDIELTAERIEDADEVGSAPEGPPDAAT